MKTLFKWLGGIAVLVVLAIVGAVGYVFYSISSSIKKLDAVPLSPANYQPAAVDLVKLCQSDPGLYSRESTEYLEPFDPVWVPASVAKLHPEDVDVSADHAKVFWGGGFYHCGWELTHVGGDLWTLRFESENKPGQILEQINVPADQRFTEDAFVRHVLLEFDRRLAAHTDEGMSTSQAGWYLAASRCLFLAHHHRVDLLPAEVRKSAANYPHDWRDILLAYLIDHAAGDVSARDRLNTWAAQTTGPAAWMFAAYAFYQSGDASDGDAAVKSAVADTSSDPGWMDKDVPQYELGMAVRLFRSGDSTGCKNLCDGILASHRHDFETRLSVQALRDLAGASVASRPSEPPSYDKYTALDPFGGFDLGLLRPAPTSFPVSTTRP